MWQRSPNVTKKQSTVLALAVYESYCASAHYMQNCNSEILQDQNWFKCLDIVIEK